MWRSARSINPAPDALKETRKAIEEYAVECSIIKVWGSEMIDYVVDETVQIYGGYGFVEEYPAERAYRDARINRIFEGTNEINRLIITGFLLKRAMSGQLPLMPAIKKLMDEVLSGPSMGKKSKVRWRRSASWWRRPKSSDCLRPAQPRRNTCRRLQTSKRSWARLPTWSSKLTPWNRQCCVRRRSSTQRRSGGRFASRDDTGYLAQAMERIEAAASKVIAAVADGDMLRTQLAILRRLSKYEPFNTIALGQQMAQKVIERGKYALV